MALPRGKLTGVEVRALEESARRLKARLGSNLLEIRLFGSKARGDAEPDSDLDVAVLVRELSRETRRAVYDQVAEVELEYLQPLSVLVFSEESFAELKARERRIALDIEKEGLPV